MEICSIDCQHKEYNYLPCACGIMTLSSCQPCLYLEVEMTHSLIATSMRCLRLFRIVECTRSFKASSSRALAVLTMRSLQSLSVLCMSEWKVDKRVSKGIGIRTTHREA